MQWGEALEDLKAGRRVARTGWPGSWLILVPGSTITVEADRPLGVAAPDLVGQQVQYAPHIDIFTRGFLAPWSFTQLDLLAEDWCVVDAQAA